MTLREPALAEMKNVFAEAPYGVEHTLRVLAAAEAILAGETAGEEIREIVTLAAVLHDSGALEALRKYGSMDGEYQEKEGAVIARQILEKIGAQPGQIDRVCFLIGHHHTPSMIDGPDFQILWEADLLDNLENGSDPKGRAELERTVAQQFKTVTGSQMARERLLSVS